jgi:hypothetical protein
VLATATISNRVDDGPGGQRSAVATNVESIGMTALGCGTIMLITGEIDVTLPSITLSG